jgi:murein DD-endopeptidase MepM/ murein hydrolase activator NlpD
MSRQGLFLSRQMGLTVAGIALLAGCSGPLDLDLRDRMGGLDTSIAAGLAATPRPEADDRGVISYPNYQVALAQRGDSVADVAARVGLDAAEVARFNGLRVSDILRAGEVIALPSRVAEPSPATGAVGTGPIRPLSEIDITELAGAAIDRAGADSNIVQSGTTPPMQVVPQTGMEPIKHRVERGETAFTIAQMYNVSIRSLAEWNTLDADFTIREGQHLLIPVIPRAGGADTTEVYTPPAKPEPKPEPAPAPAAPVVAAPKPAPAPATAVVAEPEPVEEVQVTGGRLGYPVEGDILKPYAKGSNDGVDIAATAGSPVKAAEAGTVGAIVQDTNGIDIIVIRHAGNLLTVYTHVENPVVAKGDRVTRGQIIASVRAGNPSFVHFEVRDGSESVDPMDYLR